MPSGGADGNWVSDAEFFRLRFEEVEP